MMAYCYSLCIIEYTQIPSCFTKASLMRHYTLLLKYSPKTFLDTSAFLPP